ncbi:hypothetical protein NKR23_g4576 [Pleurostoma richardsiae]|uniref:Ribonuclease P/MRP protein subunit POP5 n=1 Tax=Pleurostoma richardsiae TaxID=41990 RepID=A0AA38VS37_9PEZI|nr:hypothetical protein NKR23_g4576 [Pleurostoma richardsiae]
MVRIKERYLLVNILYPDLPRDQGKSSIPDLVAYNQPTSDSLSPHALSKAIRAEVASLFGDYGAGAIERSLQVKYLSHATSTFILRCPRSHYRLVWAALTFMDHVPVKNGKPCTFRVVRVSGTIRKVEEEAIRRAKQLILVAKDQAAGRGSGALSSLFGSKDPIKDITMVDDGQGESSSEDEAEGDNYDETMEND